MIEIVVLIVLGRRIRAVAVAHGRRPREMAGLLVACWIGFEVAGMALAVAVGADTVGFYVLALLSAAVGAGLAFAVAARGEAVPPGAEPEPPVLDRLAAHRRPAVIGAAVAAALVLVHAALAGRARGWWIVAVLVADVAGLAWLAVRVRRPGVRSGGPARRVRRALLAVVVPVWAIAALAGALVLAFGDRGPDDDVAALAPLTEDVAWVRVRFPSATEDPAWRVVVTVAPCRAALPLLRATPRSWRVEVEVATGVDEELVDRRVWNLGVRDVLDALDRTTRPSRDAWFVGLPGALDRRVSVSTRGCVATDEAGATTLAASFREVAVRVLTFEPPSAS